MKRLLYTLPFKKITKKLLITYLISFTALSGIGLLFLFNPWSVSNTQAAWFNDNWGYRKTLTFTHNATVSSATKVKFDIDTTAAPDQFQADCGDVRFTLPNGDILPYYLDSAGGACDTSSTDFYVLIPSIINGANYIYIYYGNPSVSDGTRSANFSETTTTPSGGAATAGSEEKAPSPIAYWKFDDGQGTTSQDSSINNKDVTLAASTSTPTWQTEDQCIDGKCLYFDGTNDYASVATPNLPTGDFSYSAWVYSLDNSDDMIFMASDGSTNNEFAVHLASTKVRINIDNASSVTTTNVFPMNAWNHLMVTRSGSTITVYVNGVADPTTGSSATTLNFSTCELLIGIDADSGCNGSLGNHFKGKIDEAKIYNQALSAAQVKANFNSRGNPEGVATVLGTNTQNVDNALSDGLIRYWKMDEGTGTSFADSSGNGSTGTQFGSTTFADGKYGFGGTFDGVNDAITSGTTDFLASATQATFSVWIRPANVTGTKSIFNKDDSTASQGWAAYMTGSNIGFYIDPTNSSTFTASIAASTWSHITWVFDRGTIYVYKDGVQIGTETGFPATLVATNGTFALGLKAVDSSEDYSGLMDEARVYNRALSSAEVSQLYNWAAGPVGYWKLDEQSLGSASTTFYDSSGRGNNLTTVAVTSYPISESGKYGKAAKFGPTDGSYAAVTNAAQSGLAITGPLTVSAWVNPKSTGSSFNEYILSKTHVAVSGSTQLGYDLVLSNNITPRVLISSNGTSAGQTTFTSSTNIPLKTWSYVSASYDGATVKIYINGVQVLSTAYSSGIFNNNGDFRIHGAHYDGGGGNLSSANDKTIDEVRVFNYARTQAQIIEDMNGGHPAPGSPVGSSVGYWKFDDGFGTNANDSTPNNNDLTLSTATSAWITAGKFSKAWQGNATNWASRADDDDFDFVAADDGSVSLWFRSNAASNPGAQEYLVSKGPGSTAVGYSIYATTAGTICFGVDDDTTFGPDDSACTTTDVYDATWHHITAVKTATSRIDLYLDGKAHASDTSISATGTLANSSTLYVGDFNGTDNGNEFNGRIDELKIYRSALTASQVGLDYNQSSAQTVGSLSSTQTEPKAASSLYCVPGDASTCTSPIGEWMLDEGSGTTANDSSGNAYTGTLTNGPIWTTGKFNKGVRFDGTDDYLTVGSGFTPLNGLSAATVETWVNFSNSSEKYVVSIDGQTDIRVGPNNIAFSLQTSGGFTVYRPTVTIDANKWHHIVGVYNGSIMAVYLDGKLVNSQAKTGTIGSVTANGLVLGAANSAGGYMTGVIDQTQIYNYARSAAQVAWDYNKGKPIAQWKMDECSGTTLNDSINNLYTGTINLGAGGTTAAGTCPTSGAWFNGVTGKRNYSLAFDGNDDDVSVTGLMGSPQAVTLAAWVNLTTSDTSGAEVISIGDSVTLRADYTGGSQKTTGLFYNGSVFTATGSLTDIAGTGWHHLAYTVDQTGGGAQRFYLDGKLIGGTAISGSITYNQGTITKIGEHAATSPSTAYNFNGRIDDARVFNYALTEVQVKALFNDNSAYRTGPVTGSP